MKLSFAVLLLALGMVSSVSASVTIQLSEPYTSGIVSNLANGSGVITDGMRWGIIVDTTGNGFANGGTSYDAYAAGAATSGFMGANGSTSDDYYIAGTFTGDASNLNLKEGDFTTVPGHGSIVDDLVVPFTNGVGAGGKFALVWFSSGSTAGEKYGFLSDASFVLPSEPGVGSYGAVFTGNDPTRAASNTFAAIVSAPEPSRMLLVGFGAFGLMLRRRRSVA